MDEDIEGVGDNMAPDTLGMTKFGYYNNGGGPLGDPTTAEEYYFLMTGFFRNGQRWTEGGNGQSPDGDPVDFVYPGVPGEYWSEPCSTPSCDVITPDDRRFVQSTGPFVMNPGDVQEVVFGLVWAQGDENFNPNTETNSVAAMFAADRLAQIAYDLNFELPQPPNAPNVSVVVGDETAVLTWEADLGYDQIDPFLAGQIVADSTYTLEGFEVLKYDNLQDVDPEIVAVYDVVNFDDDGEPIDVIIDDVLDPATNSFNDFVAVEGRNSGLQTYHVIEEDLVNYRDYIYGVRAYAVNLESEEKVLRGPINQVVFRPTTLSDGAAIQTATGNQIEIVRTGGAGRGALTARIVDPQAVIDADYRIEYFAISDTLSGERVQLFNVFRDGELAFDGEEYFGVTRRAPDEGEVLIDGLALGFVIPESLPAADDVNADGDFEVDFAGDDTGIGEAATPSGSVCPSGTDDPGCETYGVNTTILIPETIEVVSGTDTTEVRSYAANSPDAQGEYFILPRSGTEISDRNLERNLAFLVPDDFEMRFTENCATNTCYAVYSTNLFNQDGTITRVPFELWNVGGANGLNDESDDYRMIPFLRSTGDDELSSFADQFPSTAPVFRPDGSEIPTTDAINFMVPEDPENGYDLFAAQAERFGGPGATWDPENDGDDEEDPNDPDACPVTGYYVDFCYDETVSGEIASPRGRFYAIGEFKIADVSGDGTTPEPGTTIRFNTVPNLNVSPNDVFTFSTTGLEALAPTVESRREQMETVNVVPNPYRGISLYEQGGENRAARFINLPERATIRIFTLSGNLIRTLETVGDTSFDWDLNTSTGLPVASGMYLIHVEGRDASGNPIGEKVIKFGVVQREVRFNNF